MPFGVHALNIRVVVASLSAVAVAARGGGSGSGSEEQARGANAGEIAANAARLLGGGTARNAQAVSGGGKNVAQVDEALAALRACRAIDPA